MDGVFRLFTGDAVGWLSGLPAASAQLIVLDPGVPGRAPRRPNARSRAGPAIPAVAEHALPALLYEGHRVLASGGLCWWVTETAHAFKAARRADRLGFAIGAPLVWDRGDGPGARLAFVLPLTDGRARSPGPELVQAPRPAQPDGTIAQPQLLCDALIEAASAPGDVVVDPFMGEGAIGASAVRLGRAYLGCDLAPFEEAVRARLAKLAPDDDADPRIEALARTLRGAAGHAIAQPTLGTNGGGQLTIF